MQHHCPQHSVPSLKVTNNTRLPCIAFFLVTRTHWQHCSLQTESITYLSSSWYVPDASIFCIAAALTPICRRKLRSMSWMYFWALKLLAIQILQQPLLWYAHIYLAGITLIMASTRVSWRLTVHDSGCQRISTKILLCIKPSTAASAHESRRSGKIWK